MPLETDKQQGFEFNATSLLSTGLHPSEFDARIPMWKTGDGVQFKEQGIKRKPGRVLISGLGAEVIRGLTSVNEYSTRVAYAGDLSNLYHYKLDTDSTDTVGTGYTGLETGGATTWDSGTTTWDSGGTVWDESENEPSVWSMVNYGSWVLATNNKDKPVIKKSNWNFNTFHDNEVSGAGISSGGSGYVVGDTVTFTGGTGTGFAGTVKEISSGAVTLLEVTNFGSGYSDGDSLAQNTTSGTGTGITLSLTVPDTPFNTVRIFSKLGPHAIAFGYSTDSDDSPYSFNWCSADDVDTWIAAASNTAGSLRIREAETKILCVARLGESLAVYTRRQMFIVDYVGLPNIFGYRTALESDVGAVSGKSVVSVGRLNYGFSDKGFFLTDGTKSILIGRDSGMDEYILDRISKTEYNQVSGWHNATDHEIVWYMPLEGVSTNTEVFYNYGTKTWGLRTSTLSVAHKGVFDYPVSGNSEGEILFEGFQASDQGNAISVSLESKAHDLGEPDRIKEITSIRVGKRGTGTPTISIGWAENIDDTPTYPAGGSFLVDTDFKETNLRVAGRYIFMKIQSSDKNDSWVITNLIIQGRLEGTR